MKKALFILAIFLFGKMLPVMLLALLIAGLVVIIQTAVKEGKQL